MTRRPGLPTGPLLLLALAMTGAFTACGDAGADVAADVGEIPALTDITQVRVEVAVIENSQATVDIAVPAEVKGARDALLAAPIGGFVEKVYVEEGQEVKKGQAIAAIDRSSAAARREQAAAQLDQARAEAQRVETMGDLASAQQRDQVQTQLRLAQAQDELAAINLQRSMVTAPFAGVVGQLGVEVGEIAGPGAPVARLIELDRVELSMSVSDRDVVGLKAGMPVTITTDAAAGLFTGTLSTISPAADLSTRAFLVKAVVENPDRQLLPGMIARVALAEVLATDAVVIPQDWLVTRLDGVGVFVSEDGVARWRPVTPGRVVHDQVVITQGLKAGETIVITGHRELADGDGLLIARQGTCCTGGRVVF